MKGTNPENDADDTIDLDQSFSAYFRKELPEDVLAPEAMARVQSAVRQAILDAGLAQNLTASNKPKSFGTGFIVLIITGVLGLIGLGLALRFAPDYRGDMLTTLTLQPTVAQHNIARVPSNTQPLPNHYSQPQPAHQAK